MDTISKKIRRRILNLLYKSRASHLGSNMSMVEILLAIYSEVDLEKIKNNDPKRDRIFVSKGHSAAATYTVMEHYGLITPSDLDGYHSNGSILPVMESMVDCVEHSTGRWDTASTSLGCSQTTCTQSNRGKNICFLEMEDTRISMGGNNVCMP